jgi:hypothetical protein
VVAGLQFCERFADIEESADEIFQVRGEVYDEFGTLFGGKGFGEIAGGYETLAESGFQLMEKEFVDPGQTWLAIEILKGKSKGQGKLIVHL